VYFHAVRQEKDGDGFKINRIALALQAKVDGIDHQKLQELADGAKENGPRSKALVSVP
jgi:osmotically inducible protein OsmC